MWKGGEGRPWTKTFAHWLDGIVDGLEDSVASAADVPAALRALLVQLGFTFDDPIVGRLETGDVAHRGAHRLSARPRGETQAPAALRFERQGLPHADLEDFSLAVSLRTGIYVMSAEDVFRWLRYFRDENFYGES